MAAHTHIALVTTDAATVSAAEKAMAETGRGGRPSVCEDLADLVEYLRQAPVAATLIDIDPNPTQMLGQMTSIVAGFPQTRFIALATTVDNALMLDAMETGARRLLAKSAIPAELADVLDRLVGADSGHGRPGGTVATVLSASGGCGATTVAINLANEMHLATEESALLVDLDCHFGVADTYLGLRGTYGLADVIARPGEIDPDLVRSTAVDYHDQFRLLRSPAIGNLPAEQPLPREQLMKVVRSCAAAYDHTVLDAPRVPMSIAAELASASALTLIILQMTVKDLRVTRSMLAALSRLTTASANVLPVINRYSKRGSMISGEEAGKVLGCEYATISNDYRSTIRSINFGQTLHRVAPRSPCRRDIQSLAQRIIEMSQEPQHAVSVR